MCRAVLVPFGNSGSIEYVLPTDGKHKPVFSAIAYSLSKADLDATRIAYNKSKFNCYDISLTKLV